MRTAFKKAAKDNTDILHKHLGEFLEGTWSLARKSTDVIDTYRVRIKTEGKELDSTLVLRNIISDLCCCLDSLERGGCRTIDNNLRMSFEDYCCALQLHADPKAYALFLKEDLDVHTFNAVFAEVANGLRNKGLPIPHADVDDGMPSN